MLYRQIHSKSYQPGRSICFSIADPKPREIFAAPFRDRIIHHLFISELDKIWARKISPHSFACFKGRGPHVAFHCVDKKVRKISCGGRRPVYCLQLDMERFFISVYRPTLKSLIMDSMPKAKDQKSIALRWLAALTCDHDARDNFFFAKNSNHTLIPPHKSWLNMPKDYGIPIGNLTSQCFSSIILAGLDHFITRKLKPQAYLRYMDDQLLMDSDPQRLESMVEPIDRWLRTFRKQNLNRQKTKFGKLEDGIVFLGLRLVQMNSPQKPLMIQLPKIKQWQLTHECRKLEKITGIEPQMIDPIFMIRSRRNIQDLLAPLNSRLGFASHTKSFSLRKGALDKMKQTPIYDHIKIRADQSAVKPI